MNQNDSDFFLLKDYITFFLSLFAFCISFYNTAIISRNGFKLNTFNAVIDLNKEFNEHFKNYEDRSRKISEVSRVIELKTNSLSELSKKESSKESRELEICIKHLYEDLDILISQREMDVENCMNIMDIIYFGTHRLNILSNELRYNFSKIAYEAIHKFKEAHCDWIETSYENVYKLLENWKELDKNENQKLNNVFTDDISELNKVFLKTSRLVSKIVIYFITSYFFNIIFIVLKYIVFIIGLFGLYVIFKMLFSDI